MPDDRQHTLNHRQYQHDRDGCRIRQGDAAQTEQRGHREGHQHEVEHFVSELHDPVEEGQRTVAEPPEGNSIDGEGGGSGRRPGQAAQPGDDPGEVADHDRGDTLPDIEAEGDQQRAVDHHLDVEYDTAPHQADLARCAPAFGIRDPVDAVPLDHTTAFTNHTHPRPGLQSVPGR